MKFKSRRGSIGIAEIMIVVVVIGLLAAMAIPAFQKLRENSIVRAVESGKMVSQAEYNVYLKSDLRSAQVVTIPNEQSIQTIKINGKIYNLIPQ